MPRQPYAPTSRFQEGYQSAYDGGLSWFPDVGDSYTVTPFPLGSVTTDLATAGGAAVGGPAGAAAGNLIASVVGNWFGGDAIDQARQARVNYFATLAVQGNVAAAQLILGAIPNVSGNERGMWEAARDALNQSAPAVMAQARADGPIVLANNGDTAQNYPGMRRVTSAWAAAHPIDTATGAISNAFTTNPLAAGGVSVGLIAAAAIAAALLLGKRRR